MRLQIPSIHAGTPPLRTTRGIARRTPGSTGYRRKKQVFWRKRQGLDKKTGKQETSQNRRRIDKDNRSSQIYRMSFFYHLFDNIFFVISKSMWWLYSVLFRAPWSMRIFSTFKNVVKSLQIMSRFSCLSTYYNISFIGQKYLFFSVTVVYQVLVQ